jgi:hypothetical protein
MDTNYIAVSASCGVDQAHRHAGQIPNWFTGSQHVPEIVGSNANEI